MVCFGLSLNMDSDGIKQQQNKDEDNQIKNGQEDCEEVKQRLEDIRLENENIKLENEQVKLENEQVKTENEEPVTDDEYAKEIESNLTEEQIELRRKEAEEMKKEGNELFKQKQYEKSVELYTNALRLCPTKFCDERSVMYANRAAARIHLDLKQKASDDCTKAINLNPNYTKAILRRAQILRESQEKLDEALADYKRVLELDSNCTEAKIACNQLSIEINQRNEKMKQEMMGKLKDLGNLVLRPFGLSTDNFKMTQNESGGYSVNFQNN